MYYINEETNRPVFMHGEHEKVDGLKKIDIEEYKKAMVIEEQLLESEFISKFTSMKGFTDEQIVSIASIMTSPELTGKVKAALTKSK